MDTEQVSSTETTPAAVVANATPEAVESSSQETTPTETSADAAKPNGYQGENFVEFTPEQQKRINTLTKEISSLKKSGAEVGQWKAVAKEQYDLINELRNGQQQIVNHLQSTNYVEAESQLKSQRKAAYDRGDLDAVDAANDKLADIKIARKTAEMQAKQQPVRQAQPQMPASDPVELAVQQGTMSRADADAYKAWETETDSYGNPIRSWTDARDARNSAAAAEGKAVFSNPSYVNKPFADKLKEIDRRMGIANKQAQQGVMPAGNLTGNAKTSNIKLSPQAENLAVRTKFAGPGKSNADHIEAYRKQVAEVRGGKK